MVQTHFPDPDFGNLNHMPPEDVALLQQTNQGLQVLLPWKPRKIRLGAGFSSQRLLKGDPFVSECPFILSDLLMIPKRLRIEHGTTASYRSTETSRQCETEDHLSLGFGISVGPPFLGDLANVSVKGQFERHVVNNSDSNKASFRSSVRPAMVQLDRNPRLTKEAAACIKYQGGMDEFCKRYGDYFVAGMCLGGETGILMSSSSSKHEKIDSYSIRVSVKILILEVGKTFTKDDREFSAFSSLRMLGYDTLSKRNWDFTAKGNGPVMFANALEEVTLCSQSVLERTLKLLEQHGLSDSQDLSDAQCEALADSGAVMELLLVPMASLRDVMRWRYDTNVI